MEIRALPRQLAGGAALLELATRPGVEVVARVAQAPPDGGRGWISLAGVLLEAKLPAGLQEGQRLPLRVVEATQNELTLQLRLDQKDAPQPANGRHLARFAGQAAVSGDAELVQVAVGLQQPGLALPLPNGDALTLRVRDEAEDEEDAARPGSRGGAADGEVSFVLHSSRLGPIEIRLRSAGASLSVGVTVEPRTEALAAAAAPALVTALERATGARAHVGVSARAAETPQVAVPRVDESFDAYA